MLIGLTLSVRTDLESDVPIGVHMVVPLDFEEFVFLGVPSSLKSGVPNSVISDLQLSSSIGLWLARMITLWFMLDTCSTNDLARVVFCFISILTSILVAASFVYHKIGILTIPHYSCQFQKSLNVNSTGTIDGRLSKDK